MKSADERIGQFARCERGERVRKLIAIAFALALSLAPSSAQAFDTGPHADLTRDALTAEGSARRLPMSAWSTTGSSTTTRTRTTTPIRARQRPGRPHPARIQPRGLAEPMGRGGAADALRRREPPDRDAGPVDHRRVEKEWQRLMFLTRKWVQYASPFPFGFASIGWNHKSDNLIP